MTVDLPRGPRMGAARIGVVVCAVVCPFLAAACGRTELFPPDAVPMLAPDAGTSDGAGVAPAETSALASLVVSAGALAPRFDPGQTGYGIDVGALVEETTVTAVPASARATMTLNDAPLAAGVPSPRIPLALPGTTILKVSVAAPGVPPMVYTVTITRPERPLQRAYVKASNTDAGDRFGAALALRGDTLVIGAYLESSAAAGVDPDDQSDNTLPASGAVYILGRAADGTWSQQAFLKASNPAADSWFGYAVALSGDTLAIGAPHESSGADQTPNDSVPHSGAVYVFVRSPSGQWKQEAFLKAPVPGPTDSFGCSVALDGGTLAIGAYRESSAGRGVNPPASDSVASSSGAAYVFTRAAGGTWAQQAFIKASNAEANDLFGFALALSGDTLAAGAEGESSRATGVNPAADLQSDNSARNSGAVYIFQRQGVSWAQQAYVKASNTGAGDVFGSSVALSGDTLAVGAPAEDSSGITVNPPQGDDAAANSGAVYVFTRSATADWSQQAFLKPFNTDNDDHFGTVALTGDVLAVGAPGEPSSFHERVMTDTGAPDSGAVYVFGRPDGVSGAWATRFYLKAVNLDAGDQFGFPLAVDGDTLAVGAAREASRATGVNSTGLYDNGALESGAVYIFR